MIRSPVWLWNEKCAGLESVILDVYGCSRSCVSGWLFQNHKSFDETPNVNPQDPLNTIQLSSNIHLPRSVIFRNLIKSYKKFATVTRGEARESMTSRSEGVSTLSMFLSCVFFCGLDASHAINASCYTKSWL